MLKQPATLFRWHIVQLRQPVPHRLLGLRRKIAETRLIRKSPLLIGKRKVTVAIHPLTQMLLLLLPLRRPRRSQSRARAKLSSMRTPRLAGSHPRTKTQQKASKRWWKTTPEFGRKSHDIADREEPVCLW
jgi:hypothetical protein